MKYLPNLIPLAILTTVMSCGDSKTGSDLDWGHLNQSGLKPDSPQFLINKKADESYRVCLPQYMVNKYPGIKSEVKASINIWGHYLGRNLQVEIDTKNLPRASATDDSNSLRESYYEQCGDDYDVVMGLAPFRDDSVGQTGSSWMSSWQGDVISFKRHLFLRDYDLTPSRWAQDQDWISLEKRTGKKQSGEQILGAMIEERKSSIDPRNRSLTLPVLVHEFGHVWGMCDQYSGPTNCDPGHSSTHPNTESLMGSSSGLSKIFLTKDDITGIKALAKRPGFNKHWPDTDDVVNADPVLVAVPDVTYFGIHSFKKTDSTYAIDFGVVAEKGGETTLEYKVKNGNNWQSMRGFTSNEAFSLPHQLFNYTTWEDIGEIRLKLKLKNKDGSFQEARFTEIHKL